MNLGITHMYDVGPAFRARYAAGTWSSHLIYALGQVTSAAAGCVAVSVVVVLVPLPPLWLSSFSKLVRARELFTYSRRAIVAGCCLPASLAQIVLTPAPRSLLVSTLGNDNNENKKKCITHEKEEDMYFCEETGEFIHPIFFDSQDEAREVRASSSSGNSSEADTEVCMNAIGVVIVVVGVGRGAGSGCCCRCCG